MTFGSSSLLPAWLPHSLHSPCIPSKMSNTQSETLFSHLSLSAPFGDPPPQKSKALTEHTGCPVHLSAGERKSLAFLPSLQGQKFPSASLIRLITDLSPVALIKWVTLHPPCSGRGLREDFREENALPLTGLVPASVATEFCPHFSVPDSWSNSGNLLVYLVLTASQPPGLDDLGMTRLFSRAPAGELKHKLFMDHTS